MRTNFSKIPKPLPKYTQYVKVYPAEPAVHRKVSSRSSEKAARAIIYPKRGREFYFDFSKDALIYQTRKISIREPRVARNKNTRAHPNSSITRRVNLSPPRVLFSLFTSLRTRLQQEVPFFLRNASIFHYLVSSGIFPRLCIALHAPTYERARPDVLWTRIKSANARAIVSRIKSEDRCAH